MKYLFILTCTNDDTGEDVGWIDAYSLESLQEQMHKIENSIKEYEEYQKNRDDEEDYL
jgi:hypothetical protein